MSTLKEVIKALDEARTTRSEQAAEYTQMPGVEASITGGLMKVLAPQAARERFLEALNAIPTTLTIAEVTKSTCEAEAASDRLINHPERRASLPFNRSHRSF
jgi:hypothetical protein